MFFIAHTDDMSQSVVVKVHLLQIFFPIFTQLKVSLCYATLSSGN